MNANSLCAGLAIQCSSGLPCEHVALEFAVTDTNHIPPSDLGPKRFDLSRLMGDGGIRISGLDCYASALSSKWGYVSAAHTYEELGGFRGVLEVGEGS